MREGRRSSGGTFTWRHASTEDRTRRRTFTFSCRRDLHLAGLTCHSRESWKVEVCYVKFKFHVMCNTSHICHFSCRERGMSPNHFFPKSLPPAANRKFPTFQSSPKFFRLKYFKRPISGSSKRPPYRPSKDHHDFIISHHKKSPSSNLPSANFLTT